MVKHLETKFQEMETLENAFNQMPTTKVCFWIPYARHHNLVLIMNHSCRAVARSENPGGLVVIGGDNVPTLVEVGWIDLPKTVAPPAPPLATGLKGIGIASSLIKAQKSSFELIQSQTTSSNQGCHER
jgi:hypothetical protein